MNDLGLVIRDFFVQLESVEDWLWLYFGFPAILFLGGYFTWVSRGFQVRAFPKVIAYFFSLVGKKECDTAGVHPLKTFFACIGGCVGLGNIVGICAAVEFGGPGSLLWVWVTAILGTMVKYAEVFLGVKYRQKDSQGHYRGGPMFFLQKAFRAPWVSTVVALLLCVYGVEVFQFSVIATSVSVNSGLDKFVVTFVLLLLVIYAGLGGVRRVGTINAMIIPGFVFLFVGMGLYVVCMNLGQIPSILSQVVSTAFTGHAAMGGFIGASVTTAISQGIRRGCYSGDLGIGYAAVIHSETSNKNPDLQASLTLFDLFLDTFVICTTSIAIVLVTGVWHQGVETSMMIQRALEQYFPYMHVFMPVLIFLLGYSTINAYFVVGVRCAQYLSPKRGRSFFFLFASIFLFVFCFVDTYEAQMVMSITNVLLLVFNGLGMWRLRHDVTFSPCFPSLKEA